MLDERVVWSVVREMLETAECWQVFAHHPARYTRCARNADGGSPSGMRNQLNMDDFTLALRGLSERRDVNCPKQVFH